MGRPCGGKTLKIAHQIFKKKTHFQICALSYRPQGKQKKFYMGAQLHFFRYTEA